MQIQVLGAGCTSCKKLHELTSDIVKELKLDVKVDYITDISKIVEMGIMQSPVLTVNGKLVMVGFIPNREKVKDLIVKAIA
jgi:small redox-active disulfide protein 2